MDRRIVNDEQLTAYALGELEGADWAAAEQRIAQDESARRYVEDVRAAASLIGEGLSAQPSPGLDDGNKEAIENHLEIRSRSQYGPGKSARLVSQPIILAFVGLIVFAFVAMLWRPGSKPAPPTSTQPQPAMKGHIPLTIEHEVDDATTRPSQ